MKQAVRSVAADADVEASAIRVWVDVASIPQMNRSEQRLAINSLPTFASTCDYFVRGSAREPKAGSRRRLAADPCRGRGVRRPRAPGTARVLRAEFSTARLRGISSGTSGVAASTEYPRGSRGAAATRSADSLAPAQVVVAPDCTHADTGKPCDARTYRSRAWCSAVR